MWKRIALMIGVLTAVMGAVLPIGPSAPKYVAAYHSPLGYFSEDYNYFLVPHVRVPLHAPAGAPPGNPNGVYRYDSSGFPAAGTYYNYWVDSIFNTNIGSLAAQVRQLTVSQEQPSPAVILLALALFGLGGGLAYKIVKKSNALLRCLKQSG